MLSFCGHDMPQCLVQLWLFCVLQDGAPVACPGAGPEMGRCVLMFVVVTSLTILTTKTVVVWLSSRKPREQKARQMVCTNAITECKREGFYLSCDGRIFASEEVRCHIFPCFWRVCVKGMQ